MNDNHNGDISILGKLILQ